MKQRWNYFLLWVRNTWIRLNHKWYPDIPYQKWDFDSNLNWTSPCSWNWRDPKGIWFMEPMIINKDDPRDQP